MNTLWVREHLRELVEAAFPLDFAKGKLRELQMPVTEHLFKVFFKPDDINANHWKTELSGWSLALGRYNRVKTKSGKGFKDKVLLQILWDEPFGTDADLEVLARQHDVPLWEVLPKRTEFKAFVKTYIDAIKSGERWRGGTR